MLSDKTNLILLVWQVDNLEELLTEKEDHLLQVKTQSTNSIESSDSAIYAMEESITEKERQIERYSGPE